MPASDEQPLIRFKGVRKAFGPKIIYAGLDLSIMKGEVLTICGGSGVGKSVMLKMLIGLLRADRGSIMFDGKEVTEMKESELAVVRQRIAMLFQSGALFDSLTVGDNVGYGLDEHFRNKMTPEERNERVAWALALVGLPGIEEMAPADLSGGMRKRVGLARAIAVRPEVLLYDEPTTGLDPITGKEIVDLILELQRKYHTSSVIISHDLNVAKLAANRIVVLYEGRNYAEGTYEQLHTSTDPKVKQFFIFM
jgi:phospholipid/cholesterol/gamma-HCH transport system ATP-binding protein